MRSDGQSFQHDFDDLTTNLSGFCHQHIEIGELAYMKGNSFSENYSQKQLILQNRELILKFINDYLARPDDFMRPRRVEESPAPLVDVVMLQEFVQLGSMSNSLFLALDSCLVESVGEFLEIITYVRKMLVLESEMLNSS